MHAQVIVIGSGPAACTAGIYSGRAGLKVLLLEGFLSGTPGGQLMTTTEIENFPGFLSIQGPDLMHSMRAQVMKSGVEILTQDVTGVDLSLKPFLVFSGSVEYTADVIIIATGASAKKLPIPGAGEGEFWQKGVTACAVCDGAAPIFRNKNLFVIGGGDAAVEEALFLTRYASKVYLVHRRDVLRASKAMSDKIKTHDKVEILWNSEIIRISGKKFVENVVLKNNLTGKEISMEAGGVFFAVGHTPNVDFLKGQLRLDESGYILTEKGSTHTSVKGVFAAGDVQDKIYRQAIVAAGSGCMAALDAEKMFY
ncbi:MAG: thioredoxin-disulfide reductase [Victivallaceae bacterium]